MPRRSSYTLFSVRGIPIGVDWSWFLVLFLVIWLLSGFYRELLGSSDDAFEPYALAVVSALLFFGSILAHELGHAVVALRNGIGIDHITLWMFGGVAGLERDSESAGEEFRIAAAGPAVTLAIALGCLGLGAALEGGAFWEGASFDEGAEISGLVAVLAWLANINAAILLFNLLPAFPMDGGRIMRAAVWKLTGDRERATGFAARLGQLMAFVFIAGGLYLALATSAFVLGFWIALIGWILGQAARAAVVRNELSRRIGDVSVADVMDDDPIAIPDDTTVEAALDEYFLRYQWPWFPVVDAGRRVVGLLKRGAADAVPETSRSYRQVVELVDAAAGAEAQQVRDDMPLENLLGNSELRRLGALVATDTEGRLSGVITLEQVGRALREAVGVDPTEDER